MGVKMNKNLIKTPNGRHKIVELLITLVVLVISRAGFTTNTASGLESAWESFDHKWLTIVTFGGYTIILATIVIGYVLGEQTPMKMEMILMFLGCILFVATGALAIKTYDGYPGGSNRNTGLAYGSLSIINGIIMLVDFAWLAKEMKGK